MEIPTELALELMLAADFLNGTNVQNGSWLICADSIQSERHCGSWRCSIPISGRESGVGGGQDNFSWFEFKGKACRNYHNVRKAFLSAVWVNFLLDGKYQLQHLTLLTT